MVVVFRFSPPLSSSYRYRRFRTAGSRAKPLQLNILHVSTFTSKILRAVAGPRVNKFKDLARHGKGPSPKAAQLLQLSHMLSIFYLQLLSIQRFCSCSHANPMIPKDHGERGIPLIYEIHPGVLQTAWVQCPSSRKEEMSHGLSVLHASVETGGR